MDDLAAFLMHRTADAGASESERLTIFVLVGAYQEKDNPPLIAAALRIAATAFAAHPGYRAEWAFGVDEDCGTPPGQIAATDFLLVLQMLSTGLFGRAAAGDDVAGNDAAGNDTAGVTAGLDELLPGRSWWHDLLVQVARAQRSG